MILLSINYDNEKITNDSCFFSSLKYSYENINLQ